MEVGGNITRHHVDAFNDIVSPRTQQLTTKMRDRAMFHQASGRSDFFDQIGKTEAAEDNTRFPASPHMEIEHFRRKVKPRRIHWGHLIDEYDKAQMFTTPTGKYVLVASGAFGRTIDTTGIAALGGDALVEDENGITSLVSLPSTQKVAVSFGTEDAVATNVNMNEAKARKALEILGENDVDLDLPENRLYGFISPSALWSGLMGQSKFTSSDFNHIKSLADGANNTFNWMGVEWVVTNRLPFVTGSLVQRKCYIYAKSGLGFAQWRAMSTKFMQRGDLSGADYIYMSMIIDWIRLEEEKVVEIIVDQAATAVTGPTTA